MIYMLRIIRFRINLPFSEDVFKLIKDVMVTGDKKANRRKKIAIIVRIENWKNIDTKTEILIFTVNQEIISTISLVFENVNLVDDPTILINKKTIIKKDPRYQIGFREIRAAGI